MAKVYAVVNRKGGVGKSTLCENLAVALAEEKQKVKIIDCDIKQRTCSKWAARRNEANPEKTDIHCTIQVDDLKNTILAEAKLYDLLIIDVQGSDNKNLRTALLLSDIVYLPFIPSQHDIETIEELKILLEETKIQNAERKTFYILNNCSYHYLDSLKEDADLYFKEHNNIFKKSLVSVCHRKAYKVASAEGLGVIELNDKKAKEEINKLAEEVRQNA